MTSLLGYIHIQTTHSMAYDHPLMVEISAVGQSKLTPWMIEILADVEDPTSPLSRNWPTAVTMISYLGVSKTSLQKYW